MHADTTRRRAHAALALLLQYPDTTSVQVAPRIRELARELSADQQVALEGFVDWLTGTPLLEVQSHYVDLFDRKRRACLYLSYYLNGDTRRRGMALVEFKELYREHGFEASSAELPDFLPTLLQFCAAGDLESGEQVLASHRGGLEVLLLALQQARSPYGGPVEVLLSMVPASRASEEQAQVLIASGPPAELVGLEPFAAAETMGVGAR